MLRGSLAIPMRHHLTTVPLARRRDGGGWRVGISRTVTSKNGSSWASGGPWRALPEAERLRNTMYITKVAPSDRTLGSPTAASSTLSTSAEASVSPAELDIYRRGSPGPKMLILKCLGARWKHRGVVDIRGRRDFSRFDPSPEEAPREAPL